MNGWQDDKLYSDRFTPEIKSILGRCFIAEAPIAVDQREATDLLILDVRPVRVGCRVRRFRYWQEYGGQFTIRVDRPSGNATEFGKILDGLVDFLFYGFADPADGRVYSAIVLDVRVMVGEIAKTAYLPEAQARGTRRRNADGSGDFLAFDVASFPAKLIRHQHGPAWARTTTDLAVAR